MLKQKTRRIILIFCCGFFVIVATAVLLYSQGYGLDRNGFSRRGGLYIASPFSGSEIFVNNKKEKTIGAINNSFFKSNLKLGEYSILVAKENYWPWAKTLEVKEGFVTEAYAIMVPENPKGENLLKGKFSDAWSSPEKEIVALIEKNGTGQTITFYLPAEDLFLTPDSPLSSSLLSFKNSIAKIDWNKTKLIFKSEKGTIEVLFDLSNKQAVAQYSLENTKDFSKYERHDSRKNQKIWWNPGNNEIFIDWLKTSEKPPFYICEKDCQLPLSIFSGKFMIKNVDFFPGRKDVILIAVGNGIYALEIDGRNGRLIYPIYKGKEPTFALAGGEKYIYVLDEGNLMRIHLRDD